MLLVLNYVTIVVVVFVVISFVAPLCTTTNLAAANIKHKRQHHIPDTCQVKYERLLIPRMVDRALAVSSKMSCNRSFARSVKPWL